MYLRFENEPELEFEFFLAEKLHTTVGQLREMSNEEFQGWATYYRRKAQRMDPGHNMMGT